MAMFKFAGLTLTLPDVAALVPNDTPRPETPLSSHEAHASPFPDFNLSPYPSFFRRHPHSDKKILASAACTPPLTYPKTAS